MPSGAETAAERFRAALHLFDLGVRMMRQKLRRDDPTADESQIERRLQGWLSSRPGAEYGDAEGTPRAWPPDRG